MKIRKIIKLFKYGNVCVVGMRGRGKDLLFSNVIARRKIPYVSNVEYSGAEYIPFELEKINCGNNTYKNFLSGKIYPYTFPYKDGTDVYISDVGIYFPSQYCNELNRDYKQIPVFMALSRHLGKANVHINVQALNRAWDKLREQSDTYILCKWCKVLFGKIVIQKVIIYDKYESCLTRQPPFRVSLPLTANKQMKLQAQLEKERYECQHGKIKSGILLYINKSKYDNRIFKKILEQGANDEKKQS